MTLGANLDVFSISEGGTAPTCTGVTQSVAFGATKTIGLTCNEPDGDALTRAIAGGPSHGTLGPVDQQAGTVAYTPAKGYSGPDAFTFRATDKDGPSNTATATINVGPAPSGGGGTPTGGGTSTGGTTSTDSGTPTTTGATTGSPQPASVTLVPSTIPPVASAPQKTAKELAAETFGLLPSTKKCVSRRGFRIRLRNPKGTTIAAAVVKLDGKPVATRRGRRVTAPIDLRGLPKGTFVVKITILLSDGRTVTGTRTYHTCAPRRRGGKPKV